jgi:hypothetical protein
MKQRYYILVDTNHHEYGAIFEEVGTHTDNGQVLLNSPVGREYAPEVYKLEDVREISEEQYNLILEMLLDGWREDSNEIVENIIKKVL